MRSMWSTVAGWIPAAVLAAAAGVAHAEGLELGDEAPDLEVTEWIQGPELQISENPEKHIRVVQFFNTYDQGCAKAVPGLKKLVEDYEPKGVDLVTITTQAADAAREFIEKREVKYRVAVDQYNNTNAVFMKGVHKLPFAFLIDRDNKIAWMGSPDEGLQRVLGEVLEGTYDAAKEKKIGELRGKLFASMQRGKFDEMGKAAQELLELDATDGLARMIRLQSFQMTDDRDGYKEWTKAFVESVRDDADSLAWIAENISDQGDLTWRDPELALAAVTRAVELSKEEDADILSSQASVLFALGHLDEALAAAKKALALDTDDEDHQAAVAYYEKCVELRKPPEKTGGTGGKKKRR